MPHYSKMSSQECKRVEQRNNDLDRIREALEALDTVEEACRVHQLWAGNHIEQIRLILVDELARVEEGS